MAIAIALLAAAIAGCAYGIAGKYLDLYGPNFATSIFGSFSLSFVATWAIGRATLHWGNSVIAATSGFVLLITSILAYYLYQSIFDGFAINAQFELAKVWLVLACVVGPFAGWSGYAASRSDRVGALAHSLPLASAVSEAAISLIHGFSASRIFFAGALIMLAVLATISVPRRDNWGYFAIGSAAAILFITFAIQFFVQNGPSVG